MLRIEDTDQERFVQGSTEKILEALTWYGLSHDEEPVYQSQRLDLYQKHAAILIEQGSAYYCFCSAERLAELRKAAEAAKQPSKYDRHCLSLSPEEIQKRVGSGLARRSLGEGGEKFVVRLRIPEGKTIFTDLIRGKVEFKNELIDDQVLLKSDGFPTYHLANVVDDYEMKISHVIRAEEWLSSTPKHIILYNAFGWKAPEFAHLPLILGADRSKLSKRHGSVSALAFRDEGYLPEAVVNFLALLGWSDGTDREFFTLQELTKAFSLAGVRKSGAIFDRVKLDWMNGYYIHQLSIAELRKRAEPFLQEGSEKKDKKYIEAALKTIQERLRRLDEIPAFMHFYFTTPRVDPKLLVWKKADAQSAKEHLERLVEFYEKEKFPWKEKSIEEKTKGLIEKENLGVGETLWPMRVALSGEKNSPGPFEIAGVLGKEETVQRLKNAISTL